MTKIMSISKVKYQISNVKYQIGFTLIEFLIVIGIIALLASIVAVAINPGALMQKARDNQRKLHINAIHSALTDYKSREGSGDFPACIGTSQGDVYSCQGDLVSDYIAKLPEDPSSSCVHDTGYFVKKKASTGVLGVKAMCAEGEDEIIVGEW